MKLKCLTTALAALLLICSGGIQAQMNQSTLNQKELNKQLLGKWQTTINKDTVEVWECKPYGEAVTIAVTQTVKGKTYPLYLNNVGFDARDGKLKGYLLFPNTDCFLWTGVFTTDKKLAIDMVDISKPTDTWIKYQFDFKPPTGMVLTRLTVEGVKVSEVTYNKVK